MVVQLGKQPQMPTDPIADSSPAVAASDREAAATRPPGDARQVLMLGETARLEVAGLAPEQVNALRMQYAQGMIEVQKKATELEVDVDALERTLRALTSQTESATRSGVSITATHAQTTALGRTEVIVGNTGQAARGKLTRLQSGAEDNPLLYVAVLAAAIIFGALLIAWIG